MDPKVQRQERAPSFPEHSWCTVKTQSQQDRCGRRQRPGWSHPPPHHASMSGSVQRNGVPNRRARRPCRSGWRTAHTGVPDAPRGTGKPKLSAGQHCAMSHANAGAVDNKPRLQLHRQARLPVNPVHRLPTRIIHVSPEASEGNQRKVAHIQKIS